MPEEDSSLSFQAVDWRRLFSYLFPYRWRMVAAIVALLVSTGLGLLFPLVMVRLLDATVHSHRSGALNGMTLLLIGIFLVQAVFSFLQTYLLAIIGDRIVYDLRTALYAQLQRMSLAFYASRRVGEIVSRLSNDVTQMRAMLTSNMATLLSQGTSLLGSLVIVLTINVHLTLFILVLTPALLLVAAIFGKRIQKVSTQVQDELADSTTIAEEALQGIRVVKSFGREEHEVARYGAATWKAYRAAARAAVYNSTFMSLMMFLGFSAIAAILWFGGRAVMAGQLSLGMVSGFLIYGMMIAGNLAGLAGLYGQLRASAGGVQRVFELLDLKPSVQDAPHAIRVSSVRGRIRLNDVSFCYEAGVPVIRGIDLDIGEGEILALVGPSGAGKSTLLNLIPRWYDPTDGAVEIDGHDVRTVIQASLRSHIAIVPQETMLFGGTIFENIRYGRLEATGDEVMAAARAANAHDFIMEFPAQYQTIVGERGAKLSGGQRQRIAIARALLKDPRILLMDEATSSLDSESEALVHEALQRVMNGRTTIMIAHRLSTIRAAHRIAVLKEGRIVKLGSHEALLQQHGEYARMYLRQFRLPDGSSLHASLDEVREL